MTVAMTVRNNSGVAVPSSTFNAPPQPSARIYVDVTTTVLSSFDKIMMGLHSLPVTDSGHSIFEQLSHLPL